MPNFLNNMFQERKQVLDIQIDEQRNVMYVLSNFIKESRAGDQILRQSLIDIYDLGTCGNQFLKIICIRQHQIFKAL